MPEAGDIDRPSAAEIAAALARIVSSARFRDSPQIVAFLSYVVERTLAGKQDQIKGYTIAVEALGRDASFDPGTQSIVRTEAARLRQELARYYADAGRNDPIRIEVPRGRYVPEFLRQPAPPLPTEAMADAAPPAPPQPAPPQPQKTRLGLGLLRLSTIALVLLAIGAHSLLDALVLDGWNLQRLTASTIGPSGPPTAERRRPDEPRIAVDPVATIGPPRAEAIDAAIVHTELTDALSRFEDIVLVAAAPNPPEAGRPGVATAELDYVLVPTLVRAANGQTMLSLRMISVPDRTVIWQDTFAVDRSTRADTAIPPDLVLEIAATLLQPFGVIHAAERRKFADRPPSSYQCILDAPDLARYFESEKRERIRQCLEQAIADEPAHGYAHVLLARLVFRDYVFGFTTAETLTQALALARRAVELAPTSARAHYTLMNIQVARGFVEQGLAHGDKALALNPYDVRVLMQVGGQLVSAGQVDRGFALLQQARRSTVSNPLPLTWSLFLASYLKDDVATMATSVDQMPGDYDFNLLARALLLAHQGDPAGARACLAVLQSRRSAWVERPRDLFSRFIPATAIVERLSTGIERILAGAEASPRPAALR